MAGNLFLNTFIRPVPKLPKTTKQNPEDLRNPDSLTITEKDINEATNEAQLYEWREQLTNEITSKLKTEHSTSVSNDETKGFWSNFLRYTGQVTSRIFGNVLFRPEALSFEEMFAGPQGNNRLMNELRPIAEKLVLVNKKLSTIHMDNAKFKDKFLTMQKEGKLPYGIEHENQLRKYESQGAGKFFFEKIKQIFWDFDRGLIDGESSAKQVNDIMKQNLMPIADYCFNKQLISKVQYDNAKANSIKLKMGVQ